MNSSPSKAALAGSNATKTFQSSQEYSRETQTDQGRVDTIVTALLGGIHDIIRSERVTYPEFQAAKAYLIKVGETGEWPLLLDVMIEHVVEEVAAEQQQGSKGTILGPFYLQDQARLPAESTLAMRAAEAGTPLVLSGQVTDLDGAPLPGAEIDIWHADSDGLYSGFAPDIPEGNLRGVVVADPEGRFAIRTVQPAPYQIPTDGPTGELLRAAGWHAWRPAHLHLIVRAPGHRQIVTQLYFDGGEYLESDVAGAVKPELVITPEVGADDIARASCNFQLEME